jgi:hypothetical protein
LILFEILREKVILVSEPCHDMADGREFYMTTRMIDPNFRAGGLTSIFAVNDARAMRVAELMNDYRTLQLHISQQGSGVPSTPERSLEGYRVMIESVQAARRLLSVSFSNTPSRSVGDSETQREQLQQ